MLQPGTRDARSSTGLKYASLVVLRMRCHAIISRCDRAPPYSNKALSRRLPRRQPRIGKHLFSDAGSLPLTPDSRLFLLRDSFSAGAVGKHLMPAPPVDSAASASLPTGLIFDIAFGRVVIPHLAFHRSAVRIADALKVRNVISVVEHRLDRGDRYLQLLECRLASSSASARSTDPQAKISTINIIAPARPFEQFSGNACDNRQDEAVWSPYAARSFASP